MAPGSADGSFPSTNLQIEAPLPLPCAQFNVGHLETVKGAQRGIKAAGWDGVLLGGNYVAGVALGK